MCDNMIAGFGKQEIVNSSVEKLMKVNEHTAEYGLVLSETDAKQLLQERKASLLERNRIEFGEGILPKLIDTFCDSPYIYQSNYVETITRLQDIFYEYKNESMDRITDDELLELMEASFHGESQGSLDYLEETLLEDFTRKIRMQGEAFLKATRRMRDVEDEVQE